MDITYKLAIVYISAASYYYFITSTISSLLHAFIELL